MASDIAPSPKRIMAFFKYCQEEFSNAGFRISFPQNTDKTKTYKWRYLVGFAKKIDEWELSDRAAKMLISAMVRWAKKNDQLKKGLSLLASDQILEIGHAAIQGKLAGNNRTLDTVIEDMRFIKGKDPMHRSDPRALPAIVRWHMRDQISDVYLAISKKCRASMRELDKAERSMLPSGKDLIRLRQELFSGDVKMKHKIKLMMDDDWDGGC